jgi:hypothetical protein
MAQQGPVLHQAEHGGVSSIVSSFCGLSPDFAEVNTVATAISKDNPS